MSSQETPEMPQTESQQNRGPDAQSVAILKDASVMDEDAVQVPNDTRTWYAFWPKIGSNNHRLDNVKDGEPATNGEFYLMLLADGTGNLINSTNVANGGETSWWVGQVDADKVEKYKKFELIELVQDISKPDPEKRRFQLTFFEAQPENTTSHDKRAFAKQDNAPRQLRFISSDSGKNNDLEKDEGYYYEESGGRGIRIYVVDSGMNFNTRAWNGRAPEMLFCFPFSTGQKTDWSTRGHGTCMADEAAGYEHGVAKNADITSVQIYEEHPLAVDAIFLRILNGFDQIINDILSKGISGKAVVLMSWGFNSPFESPDEIRQRRELFGRLAYLDQLGVALVAAAPNGDLNGNHVPGSFADPNGNMFLPNLRSVQGGDINDGSYAYDKRDNFVTNYGPGFDSKPDPDSPTNVVGLNCVGQTGDIRSPAREGNSMAGVFVAGLMAYFMGLGKTAVEARIMANDYAYSRNANGPKMIWNGRTSS